MKKSISALFMIIFVFGNFDSKNVDTNFQKRVCPFFKKLLSVNSDESTLDAEENLDSSALTRLNSSTTIPEPS
jgi:hypothetical protein